MEVFFRFGFGQVIAWIFLGVQLLKEPVRCLLWIAFRRSHFGRRRRHLSSSGGNVAEVSSVHAGGGDCWLPLAGYNANETVNYSLACPVLFPAWKGVNLSASIKSSEHLFWMLPWSRRSCDGTWHKPDWKLPLQHAHEWWQRWPTAQAVLKQQCLFYK